MDGGAHPGGRIGPNAITRMAEALPADAVDALFAEAGLAAYRRAPPAGMVAEREVAALHRVLRARLDRAAYAAAAWEAGLRTGDYLLANRIPRLAQGLLRALPAALAARLLCAAIRRHAWTFAGSGAFAARPGTPTLLSIAGCPLCRGAVSGQPACGYFAASFERLFSRLVHRRARVTETACAAMGDPACVFAVTYTR
ncbi:bacteriochlorophyll 4-vinyl reductase [Dankookia rubra]|uniref:Bacteriochlorophyll 4-vinyl reductase n=1 Tax=Dankookia rubra TaxID=1442381 RepID=A0A4R5QKJ9_9PROT|nr:bacteriochlorophyll 4-vinyl reductase [Dankookia rubra]TDH63197.1 bacteriochlorophyll 4-vinyl reductase [Dankookia rubra]